MLIPSTYQIALLLMILSAVCWGSWGLFQKASGSKWRYELFYLDFSIGVFLGSLLICFTAGSMNTADITFLDSMIGMSMRKMAWAFMAGFVFNLGNVLLASAVSIAGLSVAFPIAMSIATSIGLLIAYFVNPQANGTLIWVGIFVMLLAVVFNARAYQMMAEIKRSQQVTADPTTVAPSQVSSRSSRVRKSGKTKHTAGRGVFVALAAGFVLGFFLFLLDQSREGDLALSPYLAIFFFALGLMFTSMLIVPFMMNFPAEGEVLDFKRYFQGGMGAHLMGLIAGIVWIAGLSARVLAQSVPVGQGVGAAITLATQQGAPILAAIIGILLFKEFSDSGSRVRMQLTISFVLLVVALAFTTLAPSF